MSNPKIHDATPEQRKLWAKKSHETRRRNKEEAQRLRKEKEDLRDSLTQEIKHLEGRLQKLKDSQAFLELNNRLSLDCFYTEHQIVQNAFKWDEQSGVYFLIHQQKVVYVGQSVNVAARIHSHKDKTFDSVCIIKCDVKMLDKLESLYIHFLRPPLNGKVTETSMTAPIPLQTLLAL